MEKYSFKLYGQEIPPRLLLSMVSREGAKVHFGQSAEDVTLLRLFKNVYSGFYVDVGAFHPSKFSNTFVLHTLYGWNGINIDPTESVIEAFNEERPNDTNVNIAVGNYSGKSTIWKFKAGEVNTLTEKNVNRQLNEKRNTTLIGKGEVNVEPLEHILEKYVPKEKGIDLLDIDAEGLDYEVLRSNNWNKYRPKVVLIEDYKIKSHPLEDSDIYIFMKDKGYKLYSHHYDTSVYVEKNFLEQEVSKQSLNDVKEHIKKISTFNNKNKQYYKAKRLVSSHPSYEKLSEELSNVNSQLKKERKKNIELKERIHELQKLIDSQDLNKE